MVMATTHDDGDDAGGAAGGGLVAVRGGGVSGEGGGDAGVSPHSAYHQGPGWDQLPHWGGALFDRATCPTTMLRGRQAAASSGEEGAAP